MRRHPHLGRTGAICAAAVAILLSAMAVVLPACGSGGGEPGAISAALPTWTPGASPSPGITYPAQAASQDGWPQTLGWEFKPVVDISVTALGYYDDGRDGLDHAHKAAIWDTSGKQLLASVEIQPRSTLDGVFRWEEVEPLVLRAGHAYVVGADTTLPLDAMVENPKGRLFAPEIEYLTCCEHWTGDIGGSGGAWAYPERKASWSAFPANFKFKPVSAE